MTTATIRRDVIERTEGCLSWRQYPETTNWRQYTHWRIDVNQGLREAQLLGNYNNLFLFQYWMPNGKEYLAETYIDHNGKFSWQHKSINRKRPPSYWRETLDEQEARA